MSVVMLAVKIDAAFVGVAMKPRIPLSKRGLVAESLRACLCTVFRLQNVTGAHIAGMPFVTYELHLREKLLGMSSSIKAAVIFVTIASGGSRRHRNRGEISREMRRRGAFRRLSRIIDQWRPSTA